VADAIEQGDGLASTTRGRSARIALRQPLIVLSGGVLYAALAIGLGACGGTVSADYAGCNEVVERVQGTIRTETSGLSCQEIKAIIEVRPPTPGAYVTETASPKRTWKCRIFDVQRSPVLLRCHDHAARFAVARAA
jgi:hypothetical protein